MSLNLHLGGSYSRFESLSRLVGEGARSDLLAVAIAHGKQEFDARTLQDHVSPHTASDLLYKNALDRSCPHHFWRTDPGRTARAFHRRLSKSAQSSLERRCRGQLDARPRNFGRQRSLQLTAPPAAKSTKTNSFISAPAASRSKVAQHLIVTGFLNEVIQRLDQPAIAAHLDRLIEEKFASV